MQFLIRYGSFFLFLLLETYSLVLVAQYNTKAGEIYQSSANLFAGTVYTHFNTFNKYLSNQNDIDSLQKENGELRQQLESSKYDNAVTRGMVTFPVDTSTIRPDTAPQKDVLLQFRYIGAEIVNNSVARDNNYLTINRGKLHGIKAGMGVISSDGVIGVVKNTTDHFSQVMSILNKQMLLSGMIKRNRYFGTILWRGGNPKIVNLDNIQKHADIRKGDTIETSGYSEIFPGGIRIGTITDPKRFDEISVELSNDISKVRYVYVIENFFIKELKALQEIQQSQQRLNIRN
jgi:rod shape-determining protein MreC